MAFRVSVREAAAKTISSMLSPEAASEEAAAEDAVEDAVLLEEPPQAVRTADADAMPAAHRKLRREIIVFIVLLLTVGMLLLYFLFSRPAPKAAPRR